MEPQPTQPIVENLWWAIPGKLAGVRMPATAEFIKTLFSNFAKLTLFTLMLSMGLRRTFEDVGWLWQQPSLLLRSLFSVLIAVPLLGVIVTLIPGLTVAERIGIGAMINAYLSRCPYGFL